MALAQFRMLNNEITNKDQDVFKEQAPLIILDNISYVCMANNVKNTKHTRNIYRRMHLVRNGEE